MNRQRSLLSYGAMLGLVFAVITLPSGCKHTSAEKGKMENDARVQQEFNSHMADYVAVHRKMAGNPHHIEPSQSGDNIVQQEHTLAAKIQTARNGKDGKEGNVFTPDVSAYFRGQIEAAYRENGARIRATLERTEPDENPKGGDIVVNQPFPESVPHSSMPPTILLRLPRLPNCFQYEIVNRDLVIRDMESNLVVDVLRNAIPA